MVRKTASSNASGPAAAAAIADGPAATRKRARCTKIIECEDDIAAGVRSLRRRCKIMRAVHNATGDPPLRRRAKGFEGLARIIVGQQLSVSSAAAIWGRTFDLVTPFEPARLQCLGDKRLRAAGLSGRKIKTLRGLCDAVSKDGLDLDNMDDFSDAQVHAQLTHVNGIGPWTADIYLMFCLGRADAWAPGDLALQNAVQQAMQLAERPTLLELDEIAESWRPWRSIAARLLWSYYALTKRLKSGTPL